MAEMSGLGDENIKITENSDQNRQPGFFQEIVGNIGGMNEYGINVGEMGSGSSDETWDTWTLMKGSL